MSIVKGWRVVAEGAIVLRTLDAIPTKSYQTTDLWTDELCGLDNWVVGERPVGQEMATSGERITTLEGTTQWQFKVLMAVPIAAASWLGWLTHKLDTAFERLDNISNRMSHLEGKLGDPLSATVRGIEHPGSQQALSANLSLLTSQLKVAKAEGKQPAGANIARLSRAVESTAAAHPEIPETWQAAGELVSVRSQLVGSPAPRSLRRCLDTVLVTKYTTWVDSKGNRVDVPGGVTGYNAFMIPDIHLHDCEIDLGDRSFASSAVGRFYAANHEHAVSVRPMSLELQNVRVVYSGGPLLPANTIQFVNCTFDFSTSTIPPPRGQALTRQLLTANLSQDTIKLPNA